MVDECASAAFNWARAAALAAESVVVGIDPGFTVVVVTLLECEPLAFFPLPTVVVVKRAYPFNVVVVDDGAKMAGLSVVLVTFTLWCRGNALDATAEKANRATKKMAAVPAMKIRVPRPGAGRSPTSQTHQARIASRQRRSMVVSRLLILEPFVRPPEPAVLYSSAQWDEHCNYTRASPKSPGTTHVSSAPVRTAMWCCTPSSRTSPEVPPRFRHLTGRRNAAITTLREEFSGLTRKGASVISPRTAVVISAAAVSAICLVGGASSSVSATTATKTKATTVPGKPLNPSATATPGAVTLTWSAPASEGDSAITSYTGFVFAKTFRSTCSATPPVTTCTIDGLTLGQRYTYGVEATNASGTGHPSSEFMITVPRH